MFPLGPGYPIPGGPGGPRRPGGPERPGSPGRPASPFSPYSHKKEFIRIVTTLLLGACLHTSSPGYPGNPDPGGPTSPETEKPLNG